MCAPVSQVPSDDTEQAMSILLDFAEPMLIDPQFPVPERDDESGRRQISTREVIILQLDMAIAHTQAATMTAGEVRKMMETSDGGVEEQEEE
jgi:hypothetical protein